MSKSLDQPGTTPQPSAAQEAAEVWDFDEGDLSIYTMEEGSPVFLFQPHDLCDGDGVPWAFIKAKTRLAASAPELLEALRELVEAADAVGWSHNVGTMDSDIARARAAIAKATGHE